MITKSTREKGIYTQSHGLFDSCSLELSSRVCILKGTGQCAVICFHILKPESIIYLYLIPKRIIFLSLNMHECICIHITLWCCKDFRHSESAKHRYSSERDFKVRNQMKSPLSCFCSGIWSHQPEKQLIQVFFVQKQQ